MFSGGHAQIDRRRHNRLISVAVSLQKDMVVVVARRTL